MSASSLATRLRRFLNDKPRGTLTGGNGASTDLSAVGAPGLSFTYQCGGVGETVQIDLSPAAALTDGIVIAAVMQARLRAAGTDQFLTKISVSFDTANTAYVIRAGVLAEDVTMFFGVPTVGDDVSDDLKLTGAEGAVFAVIPAARLCDEDILAALEEGLLLAQADCPEYAGYTLETLPPEYQTLVLYYAWKLSLHMDAGSAVYSYNQKLGGDSLNLKDIFSNITDLLTYLDDEITKLAENCEGYSDIVVSESVRMDRRSDMIVPDYVHRDFPRPVFYQIRRVSATELLIEWQEVNEPDLREISIWTGTAAISPLVRPETLNSNESDKNIYGVTREANKARSLQVEWQTSVVLRNLSGTVHFVVVFSDTRGRNYWSDEWSLDLNDANAAPVKVVDNAPDNTPVAE